MCIILIDADAFLFARSLGLLELLEATHEVWPKPTLRCTATIARNELYTVQELVQKLEALGLLRVEHILARTPAARLKREIQDKCRVHKGEAEAIAWACSVGSDRPVVFVSHDLGAQRAATQSSLVAWDLFDLGKHWLEGRYISETQFRESFAVWEADRYASGRPSTFDGVEATFQRRFGISLAEFARSHASQRPR